MKTDDKEKGYKLKQGQLCFFFILTAWLFPNENCANFQGHHTVYIVIFLEVA